MNLVEKYPNIEIEGVITRNEYCIIDSRVHGLFACLYCVLYGIYICDREQIKPLIMLGNNHLYYDENIGDNIFNYFYHQNEFDSTTTARITVIDPTPFLRWCSISSFEKQRANIYIGSCFKLKPEFDKIITSFTKKFQKKRVLGVHYRSTDKSAETLILPFKFYMEKIDILLEKKICDLIFFTTDELELRDVLKLKYKNKIIMYNLEGDYKNIPLNNKIGLHYQTQSPYLHAKDALIECYLLSTCTMLMSSYSSSMSIFSTFINPELIHIQLEP